MLEQNAVGRPRIKDAVEIVLYVDVGRKRAGLNVREFIALRSTKYWGAGSIEPDGGGGFTISYDRPYPLQKEALRRRYGKARQELMAAMPSPAERAMGFERGVADDVREIIDKMVDDLLSE